MQQQQQQYQLPATIEPVAVTSIAHNFLVSGGQGYWRGAAVVIARHIAAIIAQSTQLSMMYTVQMINAKKASKSCDNDPLRVKCNKNLVSAQNRIRTERRIFSRRTNELQWNDDRLQSKWRLARMRADWRRAGWAAGGLHCSLAQAGSAISGDSTKVLTHHEVHQKHQTTIHLCFHGVFVAVHHDRRIVEFWVLPQVSWLMRNHRAHS